LAPGFVSSDKIAQEFYHAGFALSEGVALIASHKIKVLRVDIEV
jgi:hypothetical protein